MVSLCIFILKEISCKQSNMFYIGCYFSNGLERGGEGFQIPAYGGIDVILWDRGEDAL